MEFSYAITLPRVNGVIARRCPKRELLGKSGSFAVTSHHLTFDIEDDSAAEEDKHMSVLHKLIDRCVCEPIGLPTSPTASVPPSQAILQNCPARLFLYLKDFMVCIFEVAQYFDALATIKTINVLANLTDIRQHYPFYYRADFVVNTPYPQGNAVEDFFEIIKSVAGGEAFRLSTVNLNYKVSPTYGEKVIVPAASSDDHLKVSSHFRQLKRFPVLSYYYAPNKVCLIRSAQPLVGGTAFNKNNPKRCKEDETLLNFYFKACEDAHRGIIVDTRTQPAAEMAYTRQSGGYEQECFYGRWKRVHQAIPRYTQLKEQLSKLVDACTENGSDRFWAKLAPSNWLSTIADVIACANFVAHCLAPVHDDESARNYHPMPVLVHDAEGTDETLLVCSLVQIILSPDARTVKGFEALIEREWLQAGHPFTTRLSHIVYATGQQTGRQEAPTFLLFLDCVYQIICQYPLSFEFDEHFLLLLFDHSCQSPFGTFLGDCQLQRHEAGVAGCTTSLWSYVNRCEMLEDLVNPYYSSNSNIIWPNTSPQALRLWERMFMRWSRDWLDKDRSRKVRMQCKRDQQQELAVVMHTLSVD